MGEIVEIRGRSKEEMWDKGVWDKGVWDKGVWGVGLKLGCENY